MLQQTREGWLRGLRVGDAVDVVMIDFGSKREFGRFSSEVIGRTGVNIEVAEPGAARPMRFHDTFGSLQGRPGYWHSLIVPVGAPLPQAERIAA